MKKVGIVGIRGMVGQELLNRMLENGDFKQIETTFFSKGQQGQSYRFSNELEGIYRDSFDFDLLKSMDIIITCQGSAYTQEVHGRLRDEGFKGYWVDAASLLRKSENAILVLDPLNGESIKTALKNGKKDFVGANCTVSLLLLGLSGLVDDIEWASTMSYQAVSGAGKASVNQFFKDMALFDGQGNEEKKFLQMSKAQVESETGPTPVMGPIPWIDSGLESGQTKEEWKAGFESARILERRSFPIDGVCVRVASLRCHGQAVTIKLKNSLSIEEVAQKISEAHDFVQVVPNTERESKTQLHPSTISKTLDIRVGRIKKMNVGENIISLYTIGDQLLWGACEPLRRTLNMILDFEN